MKNKQFIFYTITSLVILNISILIINLISLTFFKLDYQNLLTYKMINRSSSTSAIVNALLQNKNLSDPIILEKFEYPDKVESYEIFLVDKEGKILIHSNQKRIVDSLQLIPSLKMYLKNFLGDTIFKFKETSGNDYLVSLSKLDSKDLYVVTVINIKVGMKEFTFYAIKYRIIIISSIISFLGSIIILVVSYKIYRNLHNPSPNKG